MRGGVEPARYKDYILTLLFVKYVSDRYNSSDNWDIEVPEGGNFDDIIALKYKKNIGEGIYVVIGKLAEQNELKGIIDIADFNSEELGSDKEAVDKLSDLVEIFQKPELDFTNNRAGGDEQYSNIRNQVYLAGGKLVLQVRKESTTMQRENVLNEWYRELMKEAVPKVLIKCENIVGMQVKEWHIKNMRTKWGTCNIEKKAYLA